MLGLERILMSKLSSEQMEALDFLRIEAGKRGNLLLACIIGISELSKEQGYHHESHPGTCAYMSLTALFGNIEGLPCTPDNLKFVAEPSNFANIVTTLSTEQGLRIRRPLDGNDFINAVAGGVPALVFPTDDHVYAVIPHTRYVTDADGIFVEACALLADTQEPRIVGIEDLYSMYQGAHLDGLSTKSILLFE